VVNANPSGRGIGHGIEDTVRLDPIRLLGVQRVVSLLRGFSASQARTDENPATLALFGGEVHSGVHDRLLSGNQGQLTDAIEQAQPRRLEMVLAVEVH
jgi:hypothetical protein